MKENNAIISIKNYLILNPLSDETIINLTSNYDDAIAFFKDNYKKHKTLVEMIDFFIARCGKTDAEIYKNAGISRAQWGTLKNGTTCFPKRETIAKMVIAFHLYTKDAEDLFRACGYVFPCTLQEQVIKYYMENDMYLNNNAYTSDLMYLNTIFIKLNLEPFSLETK